MSTNKYAHLRQPLEADTVKQIEIERVVYAKPEEVAAITAPVVEGWYLTRDHEGYTVHHVFMPQDEASKWIRDSKGPYNLGGVEAHIGMHIAKKAWGQ